MSSIALTADTIFTINFDFTPSEQKTILRYLQTNGYQLLAFKGATGLGQVGVGLPTWFAVPFGHLFGDQDIEFTPVYKVYVFNRMTIAANTVIQMHSLSDEIRLGTALNFNQDGSFTAAGSSPPGTITVHDERPKTVPDVTVGLAGLVNLSSGAKYLPFCAFTQNARGSIEMKPNANIAMMAARVDLQSGNVQAKASAPGCTFTFDKEKIRFDLMIEDHTYAITSRPGSNPVKPISSGDALNFLNA